MDRIHPVHQRMAEIWLVNQKRELTNEEIDEMAMLMKVNFNLCYELAYLENAYYMAKMTGDADWINEINIERECL